MRSDGNPSKPATIRRGSSVQSAGDSDHQRTSSPSPCGSTTSAASSGVTSGYSKRRTTIAIAPPTNCATTNPGADAGAIPANVSEKVRPTVIAGLAKLVELVNQ